MYEDQETHDILQDHIALIQSPFFLILYMYV